MRALITRKSRCQLRVAGLDVTIAITTIWIRSLLFRFLSIVQRMIMVNRRGLLKICYYNHVFDHAIRVELRESLLIQPPFLRNRVCSQPISFQLIVLATLFSTQTSFCPFSSFILELHIRF